MNTLINGFLGNIIFYNLYNLKKGQLQIFKKLLIIEDLHWMNNKPFYGSNYKEPVIIKFSFYD